MNRTLEVCMGCECLFVDTVVISDLDCDGGVHHVPFLFCDNGTDDDRKYIPSPVTPKSIAMTIQACGEKQWESAVKEFMDRIVPADCRRLQDHRTIARLREL